LCLRLSALFGAPFLVDQHLLPRIDATHETISCGACPAVPFTMLSPSCRDSIKANR
jgi:hypothetical protein